MVACGGDEHGRDRRGARRLDFLSVEKYLLQPRERLSGWWVLKAGPRQYMTGLLGVGQPLIGCAPSRTLLRSAALIGRICGHLITP